MRWLHGVYEPIGVEHTAVDATQTLHDVAKQVRRVIYESLLRCAQRKDGRAQKRRAPTRNALTLARLLRAAMLKTRRASTKLRQLGAQSAIGVVALAALLGAGAGVALFKLAHVVEPAGAAAAAAK